MRAVRILASAILPGTLIACNSILTPDDQRPGTARVTVSGTAAGPLQLITSTNFVRFGSDTGGVLIELARADTTTAQPPLDRTLTLTGEAVGVYVRLTNADTAAADVVLQVRIDGQVLYHRAAVLSDASLEYSYVFTQ